MNAPPKKNAFAKGAAARVPGHAAMRLVAVNHARAAKGEQKFPRRPNLHVLSEAISLFYIWQDHNGLWIARDAEGRAGGLFLRKQSALAFARRQSAPPGCAIMLLSEPAELDIENQGDRIAVPLGLLIDFARRRTLSLSAFAGMVIAEWRTLVGQISAVLAGRRKHRAAAERELFHDQYWLSSKNDDDLPIT